MPDMAYGTMGNMFQLILTVEKYNFLTLECPGKQSQGWCANPDNMTSNIGQILNQLPPQQQKQFRTLQKTYELATNKNYGVRFNQICIYNNNKIKVSI